MLSLKMLDVLNNSKVDCRLPTLIFEIERGQDTGHKPCVANVRSLCKQFALYATCIILSDADAVLVFGQDPARKQIILVPELTHAEISTSSILVYWRWPSEATSPFLSLTSNLSPFLILLLPYYYIFMMGCLWLNVFVCLTSL